jgi:hypothetical protein
MTTTYADASLTGGGNYTYMVRSARKQTTGSGRYWNQSLGIQTQGNATLNVENLAVQKLKAWPNPLNSFVNLIAPLGSLFTISDAQGRNILEGITQTETTNINTQHWEKGMYLLNSGGQTVRLIKN